MKPGKTGFGCEGCGERLTRQRTHVYRHRRGRHFLFENVPALVCHACGRRIFEPDAVEMMEYELNRTVSRRKTTRLSIIPA